MKSDEVISAFIDGEAVDPTLLAGALADPVGRQCLVDLLRLGTLVAEAENGLDVPSPVPKQKTPRWLLAAAAALIVGAGAFAAGVQVAQQSMQASVTAQQQVPPKADRVIELREGIEWRSNIGGM